MQTLLTAALACLALSPTADAQTFRTATVIPSSGPGVPRLASSATDGDLVAVTYRDATSNRLFVTVSDGRGLDWSTPVIVDQNTGSSLISAADGCQVRGDRVFVLWRDNRAASPSASYEPFFARSTDGGATFESELELPTPFPDGSVSALAFAAPTEQDLYVAAAVGSSAFSAQQGVLISSHDGGQSWSFVQVPEDAGTDVDALAVSALPDAPQTVHVSWIADADVANKGEVFYRRSDDGGASFATPEQLLSDPAGFGNAIEQPGAPTIAADPGSGLLGVTWHDDLSGPSGATISLVGFNLAVSTDGGASFQPPIQVDAANSRQGSAVVSDAGLALTWKKAAPSTDPFFQTYGNRYEAGALVGSAQSLGGNSAFAPRLAAEPGSNHVALLFADESFGVSGNQVPRLAISRDGGATWETTFPLPVEPSLDANALDHRIVFNALYRNFVAHLVYAPNDAPFGGSAFELNAGGFRPQTLDLQGVAQLNDPATTTLELSLSGFAASTDAFVLLSTSTTPTPLPDGRLVDLGADAIAWLGTPFLMATLEGGEGTTPSVPNPFAGLTGANTATLYAAALGFDASGLTLVTDAQAFEIEF